MTAPTQTVWYLDFKSTQSEYNNNNNNNNNYNYQQHEPADSNDNVIQNFTKTMEIMNESNHNKLVNERIFLNTTTANNLDCNVDQQGTVLHNCDITIYDLDENINDDKMGLPENQQLQEEQKFTKQQKHQQQHELQYFNAIHMKKNDQQDNQGQHHIYHPQLSHTFHVPHKTFQSSSYSDNNCNSGNRERVNDGVDGGDGNAYDDDDEDNDNDSLASMETLSDNISIWIDGEKHWISGIDVNTTCSDLICALLNYQNIQKNMQKQYFLKIDTDDQMDLRNECDDTNDMDATLDNEYLKEPKHTKPIIIAIDNDKASKTNSLSCDMKTAANKIEALNSSQKDNNQSLPVYTKENCRGTNIASNCSAGGADRSIEPKLNMRTVLPPGITAAQLATEYVIVKQYHHCEEYLDGSTKVMDIIPQRNEGLSKKQCELLLRRLAPPPTYVHAQGRQNLTPPFSSLISTDKDSGMGSPVGSARSAKFRRRKYKSSQWLAQANTLHPKLSRSSANERLMKIILAQDETIQKQLHLLREKEKQIAKIEEEKHRKRERELGKNYLLETYLNGLEEAACQPIDTNPHNTVKKISMDESYQDCAKDPAANACTVPTIQTNNYSQDCLNESEIMASRRNNVKKEKEHLKKKKRCRDKKDDSKCQKVDNNYNYNDSKKLQNHTDEYSTTMQNEINHGEEILKDADKEQEQLIEMQIFWLEKVYTINKQLQKEEEIVAKLYAKVRKYQLKRAHQTHQDMQQEIDKLDNNLALQCSDIRKVEAHLCASNELLQKKLTQLERLSQEYLHNEEIEKKENNAILSETIEKPINSNKSSEKDNGNYPIKTASLNNNSKVLERRTDKLHKLPLKTGLEMSFEGAQNVEFNVLATMDERNLEVVNQTKYKHQMTKGNLTQFPLQQQQQQQQQQQGQYEQQQQQQKQHPAQHNYFIRPINQNNMTTNNSSSWINYNNNNSNNNNIYTYNHNDNNAKRLSTAMATIEKYHNSPVTINAANNSFMATTKPKIALATAKTTATFLNINEITVQQKSNVLELAKNNSNHKIECKEQRIVGETIPESFSVAESSSSSSSSSSILASHPLFIDKNVLSSSHAQITKTIQKQMFNNSQRELQTKTQTHNQITAQVRVPKLELHKATFNNYLPKQQQQPQAQQLQQQQSETSIPAVMITMPTGIITSTTTAIKNCITTATATETTTTTTITTTTTTTIPSIQLISGTIKHQQQQQQQQQQTPQIAVHGNIVDISQLGTLV